MLSSIANCIKQNLIQLTSWINHSGMFPLSKLDDYEYCLIKESEIWCVFKFDVDALNISRLTINPKLVTLVVVTELLSTLAEKYKYIIIEKTIDNNELNHALIKTDRVFKDCGEYVLISLTTAKIQSKFSAQISVYKDESHTICVVDRERLRIDFCKFTDDYHFVETDCYKLIFEKGLIISDMDDIWVKFEIVLDENIVGEIKLPQKSQGLRFNKSSMIHEFIMGHTIIYGLIFNSLDTNQDEIVIVDQLARIFRKTSGQTMAGWENFRLEKLSKPILDNIYKYLNVSEKLRMRLVCQAFNNFFDKMTVTICSNMLNHGPNYWKNHDFRERLERVKLMLARFNRGGQRPKIYLNLFTFDNISSESLQDLNFIHSLRIGVVRQSVTQHLKFLIDSNGIDNIRVLHVEIIDLKFLSFANHLRNLESLYLQFFCYDGYGSDYDSVINYLIESKLILKVKGLRIEFDGKDNPEHDRFRRLLLETSQLEKFELCNQPTSWDLMKFVPKLLNLETLSLERCVYGPELFENMTRLQTLSFRKNEFNIEHTKYLSHLKQLYRTDRNFIDPNILTRLPNLIFLSNSYDKHCLEHVKIFCTF